MRAYSRLTSHQSKKFETNKKTKSVFVVLLCSLNIFLFIFSLSKFTYIDFLEIKSVNINGARDEISLLSNARSMEILQGSYLGLFSKANVLFYPKKQLLASIQNIAPQIQSVTVNRNGLHGIKIGITEKNPAAKVCASLPEISDDNVINQPATDCYLVDWSGLIFDIAQSISVDDRPDQNLYFIPYLSEISTSSDALLNKFATSTKLFTEMQEFYNSAREADLDPKFILVKGDGEFEMYAKDIVIYFNNKSSFDEQLQNLIAFWNHPTNKALLGSYEYIDIRFGANIFYRQKSAI